MADGSDMMPGVAGELRPGLRRGSPGFYHLAQGANLQWSLLDPAGEPVFLRGVHDVRNQPADTDVPATPPAAARLRTWGFNAVGVGGDGSGREDGLAFFGEARFCAASTVIAAPGVRLPDVFEPEWPRRMAAHAVDRCTPLADVAELVGWVADADLAWGPPAAAAKPGLLQTCLSLEPSFAAYHAAWEFVLALHGGSLDRVAVAWAVPLPNKEVVREMARSETALTSRGYARDDARWAREFANRYFSATTRALRTAAPHHLVCGARFTAPVGTPVLQAAAVVADLTIPHWTELPPPTTAAGPFIAGAVSWADPGFWSAHGSAAGPRPRSGLTSVEWMLRRGRTALRRLARHPAIVGYLWRQWHDRAGELPPFAGGLVHPDGREAREHTELLADFHSRVDALRRSAGRQLAP